jgi:hypothetical protein
MVSRIAKGAVFVLLLLLPAGCAPGHQVEMLSDRRATADSRSLVVRGDLPAGKMRVSMGTTAELYDLNFSYCRNHYRVLSRYEAEGARVGLPEASLLEIAGVALREGVDSGGAREPNLLNLVLRPGIPLDLRFSVGEGEMDLDLTALGIRRMSLHGGTGPAKVRFQAGNSRELEQMRVVAGGGPVRLEGLGWGQVTSLEFHGGAGAARLDWNGPGPVEAAAFLDPGTGSLSLSFPADLGVALSGKGILSGSLAPGFRAQGAGWVSANWETSKRHLTLVLDPGEGAVGYSWGPR